MVQEHYKKLLALSTTGFEDLAADAATMAEFSRLHNSAEHIDVLAELMAGRPEAQLYGLAIQEFHFALLAAAACQYRHACASLRLFFELSLNAVLFSAHELDLRLWLAGNLDLSWARLTDNDSGIFSKRFLSAFNAALDGEGTQYLTMSKKLYRELSEQVHGSASSYSAGSPEIRYDKERLCTFIDAADTARTIAEFSVLTRFLPHASAGARAAVEHVALGDFGHLRTIQAIYSAEASS